MCFFPQINATNMPWVFLIDLTLRDFIQGVTLTDLKEAQKTSSLSPQDRQPGDTGIWDDTRVNISLTESMEPRTSGEKHNIKYQVRELPLKTYLSYLCIYLSGFMLRQGNLDSRLDTLVESPSLSSSSTISHELPDSNISNSCYRGQKLLLKQNSSSHSILCCLGK